MGGARRIGTGACAALLWMVAEGVRPALVAAAQARGVRCERCKLASLALLLVTLFAALLAAAALLHALHRESKVLLVHVRAHWPPQAGGRRRRKWRLGGAAR